MSAPTAYPLQWPAGKPRTGWDQRKAGAFKASTREFDRDSFTGALRSRLVAKPITIAKGLDRVRDELRKLGVYGSVISTNIELRQDGLPRFDRKAPPDPGVAVYFYYEMTKPYCLACDRYESVGANLAAVAAHIEAMRTAERHGVGSLSEMFAGFAALPPAENDWRRLLGNPPTREAAEAVYRELMRKHHPDLGGESDYAAALNAAIARAREELT